MSVAELKAEDPPIRTPGVKIAEAVLQQSGAQAPLIYLLQGSVPAAGRTIDQLGDVVEASGFSDPADQIKFFCLSEVKAVMRSYLHTESIPVLQRLSRYTPEQRFAELRVSIAELLVSPEIRSVLSREL